MEILLTNDEFSEFINKTMGYVGAVYIKSVEQIPKNKQKYKVEKQKLKDTTHSIINYKYIETNVDMSFNTLKEAIDNKNYIKDECWLNSIYDFYKDTLLKERKRNNITRAKILEVIGKSEDDIKQGLSLKDILPFFEKYNLFLRVYDCFGKLIHRHDPLSYDNNNKKMYCMIKGNHVYTLNHNLKSLNQKIEDDDDTFRVKVHTDYYINEDKEPIPCRMFENIDDLLKMFKEKQENNSDKEKEIINLILKGNDLSQLVFELKEAGCEPSIKRQAC